VNGYVDRHQGEGEIHRGALMVSDQEQLHSFDTTGLEGYFRDERRKLPPRTLRSVRVGQRCERDKDQSHDH
jgi:hypothetical protein